VELIPHASVSVRVSVEPVLARRLTALALTDAGWGGRELSSPVPTLHLLYALAVGEVEIRVKNVAFTEAGPVVSFVSKALAQTYVDKLLEEVRQELKEAGVEVGITKLRQWAKAAAIEVVGEYAKDVKRIVVGAKSLEVLRGSLAQRFYDGMKSDI